jgi:hypothetical protein
MPFLKEDLAGQHYSWTNIINESAFTGHPSRRLFDRFNGHQVLFIINFYGSLTDRFTTGEGLKIEELISEQLPMEAKSEISVFNWLKGAF